MRRRPWSARFLSRRRYFSLSEYVFQKFRFYSPFNVWKIIYSWITRWISEHNTRLFYDPVWPKDLFILYFNCYYCVVSSGFEVFVARAKGYLNWGFTRVIKAIRWQQYYHNISKCYSTDKITLSLLYFE